MQLFCSLHPANWQMHMSRPVQLQNIRTNRQSQRNALFFTLSERNETPSSTSAELEEARS